MEVARLLREWKRTLPPPCITDGELRGIRATILPNFRYSTTLAAKMEGVREARHTTEERDIFERNWKESSSFGQVAAGLLVGNCSLEA